MERLPEMTSKVTTLARTAGREDPGRVADDATQRPNPEVPERSRRRTFTAKYKLEVLAAYDSAPDGEKGAVLRLHYGLTQAIRDKRAGVLDTAYAAHPERFVRKPPEPPKIPEISWINRPDPRKSTSGRFPVRLGWSVLCSVHRVPSQ